MGMIAKLRCAFAAQLMPYRIGNFKFRLTQLIQVVFSEHPSRIDKIPILRDVISADIESDYTIYTVKSRRAYRAMRKRIKFIPKYGFRVFREERSFAKIYQLDKFELLDAAPRLQRKISAKLRCLRWLESGEGLQV